MVPTPLKRYSSNKFGQFFSLYSRLISCMFFVLFKNVFSVFVFFLDGVCVGEGAGAEEFVFLEVDGAVDGDGNGLYFLVFDGEWYYFYAIVGIGVGAEEGAFFAGVQVAGELGVVGEIYDEFLVVFMDGDIAVNGVVVGAGVVAQREFGFVSFGYEAAVFFEGVFVLCAFFDGALPGVFAVVAVWEVHIGINDLLAEGAVEAVLIGIGEDYDAEVELGYDAGSCNKAIGAAIVADNPDAIIIFEKPAEAIGLKMLGWEIGIILVVDNGIGGAGGLQDSVGYYLCAIIATTVELHEEPVGEVVDGGIDRGGRAEVIYIGEGHAIELAFANSIGDTGIGIGIDAVPCGGGAGHLEGAEEVIIYKIVPRSISDDGDDLAGGEEAGIAIAEMAAETVFGIEGAQIGNDVFAAEVGAPVEHIALECFEAEAVTEEIAYRGFGCGESIFQFKAGHVAGYFVIE